MPAKNVEVHTKPAEAALNGKGALVWARRPFGYDETLVVDRGQFFRLRGHRGDEKLLRLGYAEEVKSDAEAHICSNCGAAFMDELTRRGHGKERHPTYNRPLSPREEDSNADSKERMLENIAPLYLEKTAATAKG